MLPTSERHGKTTLGYPETPVLQERSTIILMQSAGAVSLLTAPQLPVCNAPQLGRSASPAWILKAAVRSAPGSPRRDRSRRFHPCRGEAQKVFWNRASTQGPPCSGTGASQRLNGSPSDQRASSSASGALARPGRSAIKSSTAGEGAPGAAFWQRSRVSNPSDGWRSLHFVVV